MKKFRYNFFFDFEKDEKKVVAYNARTNSLALMDKRDLNKFLDFDKEKNSISEELLNDLEYGGFIVQDDYDELKEIKYSLFKSRFETSSLGLTIAPTLNCNFGCVYCYEKSSRNTAVMDEAIQKQIIELIKQHSSSIHTLSIVWYGGEPLLAMDVIENMSKEIIKICEEKNITYIGQMISNGFGITEEIAKKLKECNILSMQITLDGPKDTHDKRRFLLGGQGTYDKIISNLDIIKKYINRISVRINVDRENEEKVDEVLKEINHINTENNILVYLGFVEPTNNCYENKKCLSRQAFSEAQLKFADKLVKYGFEEDTPIRYPSLVNNYCGADAVNSYVIDPKGDLYKCWSDIGMENLRIGSLNDETVNANNIFKYLLYDASEDVRCANCNILPICMGGCPRYRIDKFDSIRCSEYKYVLEDYLKKAANYYLSVANDS